MRVKGGTNLAMNRGDSETLTINYTDPNGSRLMQGDTIHFTIKERISDIEPTLTIPVTTFTPEGKAVIEIKSADTKDKEVKTYVYDIRLERSTGQIITLVKSSLFDIDYEVTIL